MAVNVHYAHSCYLSSGKCCTGKFSCVLYPISRILHITNNTIKESIHIGKTSFTIL